MWSRNICSNYFELLLFMCLSTYVLVICLLFLFFSLCLYTHVLVYLNALVPKCRPATVEAETKPEIDSAHPALAPSNRVCL